MNLNGSQLIQPAQHYQNGNWFTRILKFEKVYSGIRVCYPGLCIRLHIKQSMENTFLKKDSIIDAK